MAFQQLDTLHATWDPCHEHGSELRMSDSYEDALRARRKHLDDKLGNLHHPPIRRSSPGRRAGPKTVDVQIIRGMRDIGQDGRVEGSIYKTCVPKFEKKPRNDFAYDMADSYLPPGIHPAYEPWKNCSIRRERSFSPVKRRDSPHSPQISLSSSPTTRTQSHQLSSPSLRSPNPFGPSFSRTNLHPQGNVRGIDLIGHQANKHYTRHLHSSQLCGLKYGACADEGYGRSFSFRQDYIVGDGDKKNGSFHLHAQEIYQDKDEEIAERGSPRDICVRNKWRNMHRRVWLRGGRG